MTNQQGAPEALDQLFEKLEDCIYEWSNYVRADDAPTTLPKYTAGAIKDLRTAVKALHAALVEAQQPAPSAAAPVGEAPLPLLVRDIAADLGTTPIQVCTALAQLGFGGHSVNMVVTPRMAKSLRAHFASPTPHADTQPAQQGAAYAALPEPLEIDWPELHSQALGCGVEDRGLHNRYECAEYGWQDGVDKCADRVPEQIFDADQMRAFADATCALRASHGQAPAQVLHLVQDAFAEVAMAYPKAFALHKVGLADTAVRKALDATPSPQAADSVLEDAMRYRWLAAHCRSTSEHWGGRWSIVVEGPAPKSHDSEDDFDAAIDAGRKQGANHDNS